MSAADQKLHRELLSYLYDAQKEDFRRSARIRNMLEEFPDLDKEELRYHLKRLQENRFVDRKGAKTVQITVDGVERLDQEGYDTFLDSDFRYGILRVAYEQDRGASLAYTSQEDISEALDVSLEDLAPHIWYLRKKRFIEITGSSGNIQLTGEGRNRYEEYRDEGLPIPRSHPLQQFTQHTIAEGNREKAENVFRDIVEVSREEVIIIDAYAKGRLYRMLADYVPDVVDVNILMSDKEVEKENVERYREYADGKRGDVELRYLDYREDYPFHTREVIRDREAGWIWDHTLADAGNRHHTISQLRPVNLENDLEAFDEAWAEAEVVE